MRLISIKINIKKFNLLYPNKGPVKYVKNEKRDGKNDPAALVDPLGDFLRRHCCESIKLSES